MGVPKNLGEDTFPDLVGYFGAPWRPFWIFEVLIEGMIKSKNSFSKSWLEGPIIKDLNSFQTLSAILDQVGGAALQPVSECPQRR